MSEQIADTFIEALRALERNNDLEPMAAVYTDKAAIGNVQAPDRFHGPDGARKFWGEYRGAFQTLESTFRNVIAGDGKAALEWTTTGTAFDGASVTYSGVTLLESDGNKLTRSCAYFDPTDLGRQIGE
ncbi:MAG: nuclear transport factor 2 family protein [Armatimonadota bacterium]|nr:nuclear transport factor 2 family protein [Armatimonadota bacterium]